jgi:diacylglycerol O-acyltransferase
MQRLRGTDAQAIYYETYTSPFVTLKALIYEQVDPADPVGAEDIKRAIARSVNKVGYHGAAMRVMRIPLDIHHPVWVRDPDFDLEEHIYHIALPAPGGKSQLCDFISRLMGMPLDSQRPLWETWIVEGLEGGKIALVSRVHHALADGMTSARDIVRVHSLNGVEEAPDHQWSAAAEPVPSRLKLAAVSLVDLFRAYLVDFPKFYHHLKKARLAARELKDSENPAARPFEGPYTFLNRLGGVYRVYRYETFPLSDIKSLARQLDCTINTLVLGICSEALRRYFIDFDELPEKPLVVSMPVGVIGEGDELHLFDTDIHNNSLALSLVRLDLTIEDFRERLRDIGESSRSALEHLRKTEGRRFDNFFDFMPGTFVRLLSKWLEKRVEKQDNPYSSTVISNVAGPRETLFLCNGRLKATELLSCGNIADATALNITVWSYVDRITFSFLYRKGIFSHPDRLNQYVADTVQMLREMDSRGQRV